MGETAQARCRCDLYPHGWGRARARRAGREPRRVPAGSTSPAATDAASKADQPCASPPLPHDGVKVVMHIFCQVTGRPLYVCQASGLPILEVINFQERLTNLSQASGLPIFEGCSVLRRPLWERNVCTTPSARRGRGGDTSLAAARWGCPRFPLLGLPLSRVL